MTATIKRQIDQLSKEQIDDIIAYAKWTRHKAKKSEERFIKTTQAVGADPYDFVLDIICNICRKRGLGSDSGLAVDVAAAKNLTAYDTFRKEIPEVIRYIESFAHNRAIQISILRMGYSYLTEDRVIQHMGGLLSMTAQIPTALEQMFPGYYAAGLMPLVVNRLAADKVKGNSNVR